MRWRISEMTWLKNVVFGQSKIVYFIWFTLVIAMLAALATARWYLAFVALRTLVYSMLPTIISERFNIKLPVFFLNFVVLFIFGTTFLGEEFDFYERYWWWDIMLHGSSAVGFGLIGFILVFMLFQGDKYAAPPLALALIAYCFAITIGTGWEIYEFAMDQLFGLNMQRSGLIDTMTDFIVNAVGASIGATAGLFYLTNRGMGRLTGVIDEFVRLNHQFFKKRDRK